MKYISKTFIVGSTYFFKNMPGFQSKDEDILVFTDGSETFFEFSLWFRNNKQDKFVWKKKSPEEIIYYLNNVSELPMEAGAFLNKEICDFIGFTLEHLKQIKQVFERIDDKHKYEQIIFDSYIKNEGFFLNDVQLEHAYNEYKKYR